MAKEPTQLGPFEACLLKTRRAALHKDVVVSAIADYLRKKPVRILVEQPDMWRDLNCHAWTARVFEHPDPMLSAVIGDCVHNLRTALDLLATDLVRLNGGNGKNVYFPFAESASELPGQIKAKNMSRASSAVRDLLLNGVKPYRGGNDALRGLHDLDICDKHKALIPAVSTVQIPSFTLFLDEHPNVIPEWKSAIALDGQQIMVMPATSNVAIGSEVAAAFDLVFENGYPFAGVKVAEVLNGLCEYVPRVIEAFASLCRGQAFPEGVSR